MKDIFQIGEEEEDTLKNNRWIGPEMTVSGTTRKDFIKPRLNKA